MVESDPSSEKKSRVSFALPPEVYQEVQRLADEEGVTMTDLWKRGLELYVTVRNELHNGSQWQVRLSDGSVMAYRFVFMKERIFPKRRSDRTP